MVDKRNWLQHESRIPAKTITNVPWSVMTYYDGGRLGHSGCFSHSATEEEAIRDAKQWARDHPGLWSHGWYRKPETRITVNGCNIISGNRE